MYMQILMNAKQKISILVVTTTAKTERAVISAAARLPILSTTMAAHAMALLPSLL